MTVRDLKLAIACAYESEEIKSLNKFFNELFSGLTIYTINDKPDLIFMKGDKFIMKQDLKNGYLDCRYAEFWEVLEVSYHYTHAETREIIQYKVEEAFKMGLLTPNKLYANFTSMVEEAFKMGLLTPQETLSIIMYGVEEAFKMGILVKCD